jgi:hypothetical protein
MRLTGLSEPRSAMVSIPKPTTDIYIWELVAMKKAQLVSPHNMNKYLYEEITTLLHINQIYELGSYGWIDADTHDPELVGHAMAQTDSFSWRFLLAALESPSPPKLMEWQKSLAVAGEDFEGLLEAARLSIGLTLFQDALSRGNAHAPEFFSLHLMGAMFLLGAASDRLRDFYISAIFQKIAERPRTSSSTNTDYYAKGSFQSRGRRQYATPFYEASICKLAGRPEPIASSSAKLPALADEIDKFRFMRNEIVHRIATKQGQQQHRLVNDPPSSAADKPDWEPPSERILQKLSEEAEAEHRERIDNPMRWYRLLVKASNHVFIIENTLRV